MLYLASVATQMNAQVTIGSLLAPNQGALLDLKEDGQTTKGLKMPTVELKEVDKLTMGNNVIADDGTSWLTHTGLVVYNSNKCFDIGGEGLYVWDGSQWMRFPERNIYDEDALFQPNSYWVAPGTTKLEIPIEKAFRIWEFYGSPEGKNRLPAESVTGNLTPVLYWQDAPLILSQNSLSMNGNGRFGTITVALAGGTVEGNAVVALRDGSGTIRWSWHIWVTDNPTVADLNGGNFTWMDRNLGATDTTMDGVETIGLVYQWGRKDPFPMSQDWTNNEPTLQSEHGELATAVDKTLTNDNTPQVNFLNSINNPLSFILTGDSNYEDWYDPSTSRTNSWYERWDRTEEGCFHKSPLDPCPKGWRVPPHVYDESGKAITEESPWREIIKKEVTETTGEKTRFWENFGVYPKAGIRGDRELGDIKNTGTYGYIWSASAGIFWTEKAFAFYYGNNFQQTTQIDPMYGFSVRCVKE